MALGIFWTSICFCVFVSLLIADRMGYFTRRNHFLVEGRVRTEALLFFKM